MTTQTVNFIVPLLIPLGQAAALLAIGWVFRVDRHPADKAPRDRGRDGA